MLNSYYAGKKVLVTGNTGFKGSWLSLWLTKMGATVYGMSLPPHSTPNHWDLLKLKINSPTIDIRDEQAVTLFITSIQPDIIFHLAAQSLVLDSYQDPIKTYQTNVLGTANILQASRNLKNLKGILVITSDKCYQNNEWYWGYREIDRLGGHDPYSSSKAATELLVSSFRSSFFSSTESPLLATARGGNVIGGGDWSKDRLIPDLIKSITGEKISIRYPGSTRPWQHVLDCLSGYLALGSKLLLSEKKFADAWNFGPEINSNKSVGQLLTQIDLHLPNLRWEIAEELHNRHHEAGFLHLDSSKSRSHLNWRPIWNFENTIIKTATWYKSWCENGGCVSEEQIDEYERDLLLMRRSQ